MRHVRLRFWNVGNEEIHDDIGTNVVGVERFGSRMSGDEAVESDLAVSCFESEDDGDDGLSNKTIVVLLIGKR